MKVVFFCHIMSFYRNVTFLFHPKNLQLSLMLFLQESLHCLKVLIELYIPYHLFVIHSKQQWVKLVLYHTQVTNWFVLFFRRKLYPNHMQTPFSEFPCKSITLYCIYVLVYLFIHWLTWFYSICFLFIYLFLFHFIQVIIGFSFPWLFPMFFVIFSCCYVVLYLHCIDAESSTSASQWLISTPHPHLPGSFHCGSSFTSNL